jgi:SAM-dependent methyltransferase
MAMNNASEFDSHADSYDAELNQGLSVSGETKDYFATGRVHWLQQCLGKLGEQPDSAIDYGCGIGDTTVLLRNALQLKSCVGLDVSARSLELAQLNHASEGCTFLAFEKFIPKADADLVYCNGVFHHIAMDARVVAVDYILHSLRPGGLFAWWENNPWNPGTRYVMSRTVFDRNASPITASAATRLLQWRGFEIQTINYLFLFPRFLKSLRFLEPYASGVPLGAQYQILCRKPG